MKKQKFEFESIGWVESPFKDRFAVPRQPGLASVRGILHLHKHVDLKQAVQNLNEFSHIWVLFVFHAHGGKKWKPSIRPPRLGGQKKVGILSSRSPHRPNPIGISVFKIEKMDVENYQIHLSGLDVIDGTPVLDIKPYLPYADSLPEANAGWASAEIQKYEVDWQNCLGSAPEKVKAEIEAVLELDPRPAFQKRKYPVGNLESLDRVYGFDLHGYDVKYKLTLNGFAVISLQPED